MKYFNVHAHAFNMKYVPDRFLKVQLPERLANFVHWILSHDIPAKMFFWLANKFVKKGTTAKTIAFLAIGVKKTQEMVFCDLLSNYPSGDDVKCVILPLDFTHMGAGPLKIPYDQQLEDIFELKMKYPNQCFPFVAIDPRSGTATENRDFVQRYMERGFSGIKLYPALGYFAFDAGLEEVYRYAESKSIPLMTHCSTGGINFVGDTPPPSFIKPTAFKPLPLDGKEYYFPFKNGIKMRDYCDQFNNPNHFQEVLAIFPDLKMCFAHLGLNAKNKTDDKPDGYSTDVVNEVGDESNNQIPALGWYRMIISIMKKYKKVYTDISYSVAYPGFCTWFKKEYESYPDHIKDRILFGTDFFMTVQEQKGTDKEIFDTVIKELEIPLFNKLSEENVTRYLNWDGLSDNPIKH